MQQNFQQGQPFQRPVEHLFRPVFTIGQTRRIARMKLKGQWHKALVPVLLYSLIYLLPSLVISFISSLPAYSESLVMNVITLVMYIYQVLLAGAMGIGLSTLALKIIREQEYSASTIFSGFKFYGQSFFSGLIVLVLTMLWTMLFILPGAIVTGIGSTMLYMGVYSAIGITMLGLLLIIAGAIVTMLIIQKYEMTFYLAADDRKLPASRAVAISIRLMKGNMLRMFGIMCSFIGWALLVLIPLYAGNLAAILFPGTLTMIAGLFANFLTLFLLSYLMIYIYTTKAVFYSDITGNFRPAANAGGAVTNASPSPAGYPNPNTGTNAFTGVTSYDSSNSFSHSDRSDSFEFSNSSDSDFDGDGDSGDSSDSGDSD